MDRGSSYPLLSWMLVPVTAALILSALSLPRQPYAGLVLRGDRVAAVLPRSPAERAGLEPGDRLVPLPGQPPFTRSPLAYAIPGEAMVLLRARERQAALEAALQTLTLYREGLLIQSSAAVESSGLSNMTISTLSNWWTRRIPRVSLPAAPASRRKHGV